MKTRRAYTDWLGIGPELMQIYPDVSGPFVITDAATVAHQATNPLVQHIAVRFHPY